MVCNLKRAGRGDLAGLFKDSIFQYALNFSTTFYNIYHGGSYELGHLEIVGAIVYQLTRNLTPDEIIASGFDKYYVDHTTALWPQAAGGIFFNSCQFQSKGDVITDLHEDMAADGTTA